MFSLIGKIRGLRNDKSGVPQTDPPKAERPETPQPQAPAETAVFKPAVQPAATAKPTPPPTRTGAFMASVISKALKIPVMSVWPGSDGADYHFQIDYKQSLEWFTEALTTLNKEAIAAGIKLAMEPKPYEPRELYMIIPTAASAVLVASRVNQASGGSNCGLTIDYGHQKWRRPRRRRRAIWPPTPACPCTSSTSTTRARGATTRT